MQQEKSVHKPTLTVEGQVQKKLGLSEGRYPNIYVSFKVANMVGQKTDYVRNKGSSIDVYKQIIINVLETMDKASVTELKQVLVGALLAI